MMIGENGWKSRDVQAAGGLDVRRIYVGKFGGGVSGTTDAIRVETDAECIAIGGSSLHHAALITPDGYGRPLMVSNVAPIIGHVKGPFLINPFVTGITESIEILVYSKIPPSSLPVARAPYRRLWKGGTIQGNDFSALPIGAIFLGGRRRWKIGYNNGNVSSTTLGYQFSFQGSGFNAGVTVAAAHTDVVAASTQFLITSEMVANMPINADMLQLTSTQGFNDALTTIIMDVED